MAEYINLPEAMSKENGIDINMSILDLHNGFLPIFSALSWHFIKFYFFLQVGSSEREKMCRGWNRRGGGYVRDYFFLYFRFQDRGEWNQIVLKHVFRSIFIRD